MSAVIAPAARTATRESWRAELRLGFVADAGRTRLAERRHAGPLVVQRPFYPEGGVCHVYIVHPPGGVVGGDQIDLQVHAARDSQVLLTTPAAGKFYRSDGAVALLRQQLQADGAMLEWLPQENIFYPGAMARVATTVQLRGTAAFVGWEMSCFGLPASGALFEQGEVRQRFELHHDDRPLLIERPRIDAVAARSRWGLAGNAACGTLLAYPATPAHLELARAQPAEDVSLACTLLDGVLACRAMAPRADRLRSVFVALWQTLRPTLSGRLAVQPRIWAT